MQNRIFQPFQLLAATIGVLAVLHITLGERTIWGIKLKGVNLLSDLTKPPTPTLRNTTNNGKSLLAKNQLENSAHVPDSLATKVLFNFQLDSVNALDHFFNSLYLAKHNGTKSRVAYFGDSMIEGDLLTQDLRNLLQKEFGGRGVGFVPITSPVAGFRRTITNNASENWEVYNLVKCDTSYTHRPGISGYSFIPTLSAVTLDTVKTTSKSSWSKFIASKAYHNLNQFYNVKLYYGKSAPNNSMLAYNFGKGNQNIKLNGDKSVNEITLNKQTPQQYLTLNMVCNQPTPVYGLSFDSDTGVFVDNFSFRGNSGLSLTKIPGRVLSDFNIYLNYNLIVLQYGLNVANASMKDYTWYETGMIKVIEHLKKSFPAASVLLVSVGDKSYNNHGTYETDPSIPILVESQKRIAQKTGAAFWSLYDAMGGSNSMVKWVEGDTILANKDYTHLNHKGAAKVAQLLYQHLMEEYKLYEQRADKKLAELTIQQKKSNNL